MARDMREQGKIPVCELKGGRCFAPLEAFSARHGGNIHSPIVPHVHWEEERLLAQAAALTQTPAEPDMPKDFRVAAPKRKRLR